MHGDRRRLAVKPHELNSTTTTGAPTPVFRLLQPLRAFAALTVVAHHLSILLGERNHLPVRIWRQGASGVDIFFVISGFVMALTTRSMPSTTETAGRFLVRRLQRIVPLYWLLTLVMLLLRDAGVGGTSSPSELQLLASLLFVPMRNSVGNFHPVLVVGWTLNFEMAFYLLFALALLARVRAEWVLVPALVLLATSAVHGAPRLPGPLEGYQNSVVLEFLYGVALARLLPWVVRVPAWLACVLACAGLTMIFVSGAPETSVWRGVLWGLPATIVVCAVLALEKPWGKRLPHWPVELGDASYSIYLTHGFVLPALGLLLARTHHETLAAIPLAVALGLAICLVIGEGTYRCIERPVILWFKGKRRSALPIQ